MLRTERTSVTQCRRRCINEGPVSMGVALSHDLLRVSLCCSWLLCCKANFLFAIISKCHFYCIHADARRYGSIECAVYAYAVIPRTSFLGRSNTSRKSVRITENHAEIRARGNSAWSPLRLHKYPWFPLIFIWDVYGMRIDADAMRYTWYYSEDLGIDSAISTYFSNIH